MIEKYLDAMMNGDYTTLATLFAKDCIIRDCSPMLLGQKAKTICGRPAVDMLYHHKFVYGLTRAAHGRKCSETTADLFMIQYGMYITSVVTIEETDRDGLIHRLTIRPA